MKDDVQRCIEMRTDFFGKYYTVPEEMKDEVGQFTRRITELGESCADAMAFEQAFAAQGLSDTFNSILVRCTPIPYQMNTEEKQHAKETAKEMFRENKKEILKSVAKDAAESAALKAESDLIAHNRKHMIEEGVYDEFTKVSNCLEDTETVTRFFLKKFRKK